MTVKKALIIISLLVSPFVLLVVARICKVYVFYTLPTTGMDPTFRRGDYVFGSGILGVTKGDIVAYKPTKLPGEDSGDYDYLGRIVADEDDTIKVKDGFVYIDGRLTDDTLKFSYLFLTSTTFIVKPLNSYQTKYKVFRNFNDTMIYNGSYSELNKLGIEKNSIRIGDNGIETHAQIFGAKSDSTWTCENMGPIVVPKDCYFILGDNRSNSLDSRARGFVHKDKIVAKILNGK